YARPARRGAHGAVFPRRLGQHLARGGGPLCPRRRRTGEPFAAHQAIGAERGREGRPDRFPESLDHPASGVRPAPPASLMRTMVLHTAFAWACTIALVGAAQAADHEVIQHARAFSVARLTVKAGDTVHFVNLDDVPHNAFSL